MSNLKIVHKAILGGWFVVRGPHQTPLGGPHASREAAKAWLAARQQNNLSGRFPTSR